jgi:hypothetical protein
MELVRAYVTAGFQTVKTINQKNIDRIVDRYLQGDDMITIAREEAKRIRNQFLTPHISSHASDDELEDAYDIQQGLRRPLPRDVNVPEGYERVNGIIAPVRPKGLGIHIEGQRSGETYEQAKVRLEKERKIVTTSVAIGLSIIGIAFIATMIFEAFK